MISVDVNVLVYAFDESSPRHHVARSLLERHLIGSERLLIFPTVATGFLRVVTDRRVLKAPAEPAQALAFLDALLQSPSVRLAGVEAQAWQQFRAAVDRYGLRGPDMTDALLMACAVTAGATWYSFDRGFARFDELTWVNPAD